MRFEGVIKFEYELDSEEIKEIEGESQGQRLPAEFYEQAEIECFNNDPDWFIRNRLLVDVLDDAVIKVHVQGK